MENNKILIIGGAGYIGGAIVDRLSNVSVLDNLTYEDRYLRDVIFYNMDVRNIDQLSQVVTNYDTIIVLAGLVGDAACSIDPKLTRDINIKHVKWLADNFEGKIVYASTCSVYGKNDDLLDENSITNPLSLYAETKLEAEQYLISNKKETLIYRLGTLHGVGDRFSRPRLDLVVNILTMKASLGEKLSVFGGEQWRPLLHVQDVAEAIVYGLDKKLQGIYNLSERNITIKEIAESILLELPGSSIEYNNISYEDKRNYKVKNEKILSEGWGPKYSLQVGIQQISSFFKKTRIKNPNADIYHNGKFIKEYYGTKNN
jgi:nucleoside-diphosphate-sugar epimerase